MINPNCRRKLAWDWLVCAFVVFTTLATPLDLAFFDPSCRLEDPQARRRRRRNAAGGRGAALRCACGANAECTLRGRAQAPLASQFFSLTRACQAENLGNATLTTAADAAAYVEHRYAMRTACKPAALDGLDHLVRVRSPRCLLHTCALRALWLTRSARCFAKVDAVFWLDIVLTFFTGILLEREGTVECAPAAGARGRGSRGADACMLLRLQLPAGRRCACVPHARLLAGRALRAALRRRGRPAGRRRRRRRRPRAGAEAAAPAAPAAPLAPPPQGAPSLRCRVQHSPPRV
jgi:hypothetical protein